MRTRTAESQNAVSSHLKWVIQGIEMFEPDSSWDLAEFDIVVAIHGIPGVEITLRKVRLNQSKDGRYFASAYEYKLFEKDENGETKINPETGKAFPPIRVKTVELPGAAMAAIREACVVKYEAYAAGGDAITADDGFAPDPDGIEDPFANDPA